MRPKRERGSGVDDAAATVRSLLALSLALERAAATRYDALAARMTHYGNLEVSELFASLAEEERRHETSVERLLASAGGTTELGRPPAASPEALLPEAEADAGGPYLMTPYRALRLASEAEQRAFRYFIEIAGRSTDAEVRRQAEALAVEELDHLARIRKERRRAWHAERRGKGSLALPIRGLTTPDALLARAHAIESEVRNELATLAASMAPEASATADFLMAEAHRQDALLEELARKLAARAASKPTAGGGTTAARSRPQRSARDALRTALSSAEQACEAYLAVAELSQNEGVLTLAQWLAERSTQRLSRVAAMLDRAVTPAERGSFS